MLCSVPWALLVVLGAQTAWATDWGAPSVAPSNEPSVAPSNKPSAGRWAAPLPPTSTGRASFGSAGQMLVSIQNVAGIHTSSTSAESYDVESRWSDFGLNVLGTGTTDPFFMPDVGFDVFTSTDFSVGATAGMGQNTQSASARATTGFSEAASSVSVLHWKLTPRLGWAVPGRVVSGWLRGGVGLLGLTTSEEAAGRASTSGGHLVELVLDGALLVHGEQRFAFIVDPQFHWVISESGSAFLRNATTVALGVTAGVAVMF